MKATNLTRRQFLTAAATWTGAALLLPGCAATSKRKLTATDQVPLGNTGLRISRLGLGTGSQGGRVQRDLGREGFTRLVRYAYDRGITYIDTAQNYKTHEMIRDAIKGLPREKLFILTKIPGTPENPLEVLDRYRKELDTDYLDCVLTHCATTADWPERRRRVLDALDEARDKKIILSKGVSCHGLPALTRATRENWVQVHLVRINPQGRHVDGPTDRWNPEGHETTMPEALREIQAMRAQGRGIIGMKLIGNGDFTQPEDRERSIRYAMHSRVLDAAVIGFASTAEIDEAIERMNRALAEI